VLAEHEVDRDVVFAVARQPVDLVHDHALRPNGLDVFEELLELLAIRGPGRLARVHVFVVHADAELLGPP